MHSEDEKDAPVGVKAVLVDPVSMRVLWMNASASQGLPDINEVTVEQVVQRPEDGTVTELIQEVADTGKPARIQAGLASTARGRLAMVTSVYRLPGGEVLVLTENAWQVAHGKADGTPRKPGRRGR